MKTFVCVFLLAAAVVAEPPRYRFARLRVQREEHSEVAEEGAKAHGEEAPYAAAGFRPLEEFKLPSRHKIRPSFRTPENSYNAPLKTYTAPHAEYGVPEKREGEERSGGERKEDNGEKHEGGEAEHYKELELPSHHEVRTSFQTPENSYNAPFKTFTAPHVEYGIPEKREGEERSGGERKENNGEKREGGEAEHFKEGKERKGNLEQEQKERTELESAHGAYYVLLPGPQLEKVQFREENDLHNMAFTARLQYKSEERGPLFVYSAVPQYQPAAYVQLI